ncbi:hypothetical protein JOD67_006320 [Tenggerimyces flavus]|nr:hypothetical protein [Tenggerimyces flavus]
MTGELRVDPEKLFANALGVGMENAEADVVAERTEIGDVVVEAFQLQQQRPVPGGVNRSVDAERLLDRERVREAVPDRGVTADAFGELDPVVRFAALEELLDALVHEPEPWLELQDGLSNNGETEVSGFDEPRVHWADRYLVDARPLDGAERIRPLGIVEAGNRTRVRAHREPATWPMEVTNEPTRQWVTLDADSEQVMQLTLESTTREGDLSDGRQAGVLAVELNRELDAPVGVACDEEVDDSETAASSGRVVVAGDQCESESLGEQADRTVHQLRAGHLMGGGRS